MKRTLWRRCQRGKRLEITNHSGIGLEEEAEDAEEKREAHEEVGKGGSQV